MLPAHARGGPGGKAVEIYVAVPANAVTTITSAQAVETIRKVTGQPTDAPCLVSWNPYDTSTWGCTVEGWYRHELGKVFDYRVTVVPIPAQNFAADACGQGASWEGVVSSLTNARVGFSTSKGVRTMVMVLGGGGWAGHFAPTDSQVDHMGLVGDWGVMEDHGVPNSCIPEWDTPSRGYSHELAGMMGMYIGGGCYGDGQGCFVGDAMSVVEKASLLKYSNSWLRQP